MVGLGQVIRLIVLVPTSHNITTKNRQQDKVTQTIIIKMIKFKKIDSIINYI